MLISSVWKQQASNKLTSHIFLSPRLALLFVDTIANIVRPQGRKASAHTAADPARTEQ
jgi:hypothetical protein